MKKGVYFVNLNYSKRKVYLWGKGRALTSFLDWLIQFLVFQIHYNDAFTYKFLKGSSSPETTTRTLQYDQSYRLLLEFKCMTPYLKAAGAVSKACNRHRQLTRIHCESVFNKIFQNVHI